MNGDGAQRDHEHASGLVVRLGAVRRERQPRRRRAARAKCVRRDGLRDTRSLPQRDRGDRPGFGPDRGRRRPNRDGDGRLGDRRRRPRTGGRRAPSRARLLPDRRRPRCARTFAARPSAGAAPIAAGLRAVRGDPLSPDARGRHGAASSPCRSCCSGRRHRPSGTVVVAILALGPASDLGDRAPQPDGHQDAGPPSRSPRLDLDDGVPTSTAHARRGADAAHRRGRRSKRTSVASRSTTSAIARATCGSHCCRTGSTPRPSTRPATTSCSPRRRRRSTGSTSVTGRRPGEAPGSCCSTASDAGTPPRAAGWAGSASAASSTS